MNKLIYHRAESYDSCKNFDALYSTKVKYKTNKVDKF